MSRKMSTKIGQEVLGIDPGLRGAFVVTDGKKVLLSYDMPVGKTGRVDFGKVVNILERIEARLGRKPETFCERAKPMAMGSKFAFNYGFDFALLMVSLQTCGFPFTLVEPSAWAKLMHKDLNPDLKPKAKSLIAVKKCFPKLERLLPTKPRGGLKDGPVDGLLIAGYGLKNRKGDFY